MIQKNIPSTKVALFGIDICATSRMGTSPMTAHTAVR